MIRPNIETLFYNSHACTYSVAADTAASHHRRVIEVFGTERASEDFIFNNQSLPFLQQVTKSGTTYKFIQGVIYTPQEPTPIPFVSPTGFLNADLSPFVAHIQTQVQPPCLTPPLCPDTCGCRSTCCTVRTVSMRQLRPSWAPCMQSTQLTVRRPCSFICSCWVVAASAGVQVSP